ncbi:hypothetical protein AAVH_21188 [Aphelenchoides avenae]|nr:hypothetical protein AAVH_21188 [Aphelenchus avenae]
MFNPLVLCLLFGALFQVASGGCVDCGIVPGGYCDKSLNVCVYRKGHCKMFDDPACESDRNCQCGLGGCICKAE